MRGGGSCGAGVLPGGGLSKRNRKNMRGGFSEIQPHGNYSLVQPGGGLNDFLLSRKKKAEKDRELAAIKQEHADKVWEKRRMSQNPSAPYQTFEEEVTAEMAVEYMGLPENLRVHSVNNKALLNKDFTIKVKGRGTSEEKWWVPISGEWLPQGLAEERISFGYWFPLTEEQKNDIDFDDADDPQEEHILRRK